ncbi:helix-turn-helix transcriptional regulator [Streptomyces sp. NPDC048664]|uniref:helix-turn-helix domain-containing protein n=1 Tax=Streptomyces sp. NPDC048664 TaxID=3154505 RepID=UPI0034474BEB
MGAMGQGSSPADDGTEPYDWDEESSGVLRAVGKVIKMYRERVGMTQADLGSAIGYSEEQVSSVERGRRAPKAVFLERADQVLQAGGMITALKRDVEEAKYPKKVRDLAKVEEGAVEICAYDNSVVHGLLQTPEHARALYETRRPPLSEDKVEQLVAARLARQGLFDRPSAPVFNFVQEEATLRRPIGGKMVMRRQLEHMLEMGQRRNVGIQVMPTNREEHAGLAGSFKLLRLKEGRTVAHNEVQLVSRLISNPKEIAVLEIRYGIIRSQALTPRESLGFIEDILGET